MAPGLGSASSSQPIWALALLSGGLIRDRVG